MPIFFNKRNYTFLFYTAVLCVYLYIFKNDFLSNLTTPNWYIAPIMALGSFVAGSTFLGGGAIAFPALTKLLSVDAHSAKTFSLGIQSVGMSAASLYIVSRVKSLPLGFIAIYTLGSSAGIAVTLVFATTFVSSTELRILFSLLIMCFLCVYLFTYYSKKAFWSEHIKSITYKESGLIMACGFIGGILSGLVGSGADLIGFSLLSLYFRIEIKRATQLSVILMALTSLVGVSLQAFVFSAITSEIMSLWYVAAPVVLIGAPIGAAFCSKVAPKYLLVFIVFIVLFEVSSTFYLTAFTDQRTQFYLVSTGVSVLLFTSLHYLSKRKHVT